MCHQKQAEEVSRTYICFLKWPPQHRIGNSNLVRFSMNTTTRIAKLFLTAQTVNPPRFPLHVQKKSIVDKHPINIQVLCRKLRFRQLSKDFVHYFPRSRSGQVHILMAALTCLRSVETNITLTCPSPKLFVSNLPDSGSQVTSVFQDLSPSRSVRWVGENPGKQVAVLMITKRLECRYRVPSD